MTEELRRDRVRGCIFGGAVGDALGYPIEFWGEQDIFSAYPGGLQAYRLDVRSGKALISDDTQMTLFTAAGILYGKKDLRTGIREAYQDWYDTQVQAYKPVKRFFENRKGSWLLDIPELYSTRAPGNTCMSALRRKDEVGTIEEPLNASKGCGGIMRVAPLALKAFPGASAEEIDRLAADASAFTHGHSLGYMPSAVLVHILYRIVNSTAPEPLETLITEAVKTVSEIFEGDPHLKELESIIELAVRLSKNDRSDLENINGIGEGWVAEETLAIAVYCAIKYENNFEQALIAAVNHNGDSDSTGAVTGNILGAKIGLSGIPEKYTEHLELRDLIIEVADDLWHDCTISPHEEWDMTWERKYCDHSYPAR